MKAKETLLNELLTEYGDITLSEAIEKLKEKDKVPCSLRKVALSGRTYFGAGCYESSGEHNWIAYDNVYEFLCAFRYLQPLTKGGKKMNSDTATSFAKMLVSGFWGSSHYQSFEFKLSPKITVAALAKLIRNEVGLEPDEHEELSDTDFDKWFTRICRW